MQEKEIWKDIPNYEGYYKISSSSRIKRLARIANSGFFNEEMIISEHICKGYYRVVLSKDSVRKKHLVHRLVLSSFNPTSDKTLEVNHIDENKLNNNLSNLEWVTKRQNLNYSKNKRKDGSKYPGIYLQHNGKFVAACTLNGKMHYLGTHENEEDAAQCYICFCAIHDLKWERND